MRGITQSELNLDFEFKCTQLEGDGDNEHRASCDTIAWLERSMTTAEENIAFVKDMLGSKKRLTDYPDRFDPNITMHEPQMLPFGGDYQGIRAFNEFYPEVRNYCDFSTWELLGVYGEGDTVFATTRVEIANSARTMYIAEQFIFAGRKLIDVRVHVCDTKRIARDERVVDAQ